MRVSPLIAGSTLLLLVTSSASAVTMDWTPIGNPGNACDPVPFEESCYGAVDRAYQIGTYEVTNAQYAEFLNAKATSDPLGLYNTSMGDPSPNFYGRGGIARNGTNGSYSYSVIPGRENMPVNHISLYDALRFANWMNNGQGNADTESGAYTLLGGTATPNNAATLARNANAAIVLASQDEWYKAAYYDAVSASYLDYPGADAAPGCSVPTAIPNRANCDNAVGDLTHVGSYSSSASSYGTYDQGGNVFEVNESVLADAAGGLRGGGFHDPANFQNKVSRGNIDPTFELYDIGFRLVNVPEPDSGLLVIAGLLSLAGWRRRRNDVALAGIEGKRLTYYQARH